MAVKQCVVDELSELIHLATVGVHTAISMFSSEETWQGRTGAYFVLADDRSGVPLFVMLIGEVSEEKATKYLAFSQEKVRRLGEHSDHFRSWESRNPEADQWGGAVRVCGYRFSVSGLPELGDEAVALAVAQAFIGYGAEALVSMEDLSNNPYLFKLP